MSPLAVRQGLPSGWSVGLFFAAVAGSVWVGWLAATGPTLPLALVAAALLVLAAWRWPTQATASLMVALTLLPGYYGVKILPGASSFSLDAGQLLAIVVLGSVFISRRRVLTPAATLLWPVAVLSAAWIGSYAMGSSLPVQSILSISVTDLTWPVLGIAAGWMLVRLGGLRTFLRTASVAVAVTALSGLPELIWRFNPWTTWGYRFMTDTQWAITLERFGHVRVAGAFSHPIAFGTFCAGYSLLALGCALSDDRPAWRLFGWVATAMGLFGLYMSGSRGPTVSLVLVVLGLAALAILQRVLAMRPLSIILSIAVVAGFAAAALFGVADRLLALLGLTADAPDANNIEYRFRIIETVRRFGVGSWMFGADQGGPSLGVLGSFRSVDNGVLWITVLHGVVGLLAWLGVALVPIMIWVWQRTRRARPADLRMWFVAGAVLVQLLSYVTVAQFGVGTGLYFAAVGASWAALSAAHGGPVPRGTGRGRDAEPGGS